MRNPIFIVRWRKSPNAPLLFILAGALLAASLTVTSGVLLYRNTQKLLAAGQWVAHTQEVLAAIQSATRFTERIESSNALYRATKDGDQLDNAHLAAVGLETLTDRLRALTADNPGQLGNVRELDAAEQAMKEGLDHENAAAIKGAGLRCHKALQLMAEQEQRLLEQRNTESRNRRQLSVLTEVLVAGLSLIVLAVLFAFMVRDTLRRARSNKKLATTIQALENQAAQARLIGAARQELQLCVNVEQVYQCAAMRLAQLLPETSGTLFALNNSHNILETTSKWITDGCPLQVEDTFDPVSCCGVRAGHLRWRRPKVAELDCDHFHGSAPDAYFCVPFTAQSETMGVLYVQAASEHAVEKIRTRNEGLQQIVQLISITLASLRLRAKLEHQSVRDALTGLFNRHFMKIAFDRELARCVRRKVSMAVLMLDVDHFKKLNDQFGHAAGDAALKEVAATLSRGVRSDDIVCRFGGEEFVILLPEITPEQAYHKAESIRRAVEDLRISFERIVLQATISIGVRCYLSEGESSEFLLKQADAALYEAKHTGRNRVVVSESAGQRAAAVAAD